LIYGYKCTACDRSFDVVKTVSEMERDEACPDCGSAAAREFVPRALYLSQTQVTHAEYNPGLGCVVKNKRHKEDLMKRQGVVEVGNDYGSGAKMQAHFDKAREEKRRRSWEDD